MWKVKKGKGAETWLFLVAPPSERMWNWFSVKMFIIEDYFHFLLCYKCSVYWWQNIDLLMIKNFNVERLKNIFGQQRSILGSILLNCRHVQTLFGSISICLKRTCIDCHITFLPIAKVQKHESMPSTFRPISNYWQR